ncbi:dnc [Symbiodinium microadriaticum]|nr:dnc [Symbiodinium microadriaticum]
MRVQISSVSADDSAPWSLELDVTSDMRVAELKEVLTTRHGVGLSDNSKVLGRRANGLMVTLEDGSKVSRDMLLRGATVPKKDQSKPTTTMASPVQQYLSRTKGAHVAETAPTIQPPPKANFPPRYGTEPSKNQAVMPSSTQLQRQGIPDAAAPSPSKASAQKKEQKRSWLRMVQHVWPAEEVVRRPTAPQQVVALADALQGIINAVAAEPVQVQLDSILACKPEEQLERVEGKQVRIIEMIRDFSKLICRSARPTLRKKGHGSGGLRALSQVFRELEIISPLDQVSVLLGSYQYVLWMGPVSDQQARPPRRQPVRCMPASIPFAYIHHAALTPLERRKRSCFRTIAFLDMMLREYGKGAGAAGEAWSMSEAVRSTLNVWVLGARDGEEGWLARLGYCEDAAGLLSGEAERVNLHLIGDLSSDDVPSGRRVRVSAGAQQPPSKPDLVVCFHADERLARWMPVLADILATSTASQQPVLALTSRCEAEAERIASLFGQLGGKVLLRCIRNLFSGMAAGPQAAYDDHGWVSAIQGSKFSAMQLLEHMTSVSLSPQASDGSSKEDGSPGQQGGGPERGQRNPAVFWGILDLKYDPELSLESRVKVLETGDGRSSKFSGYGAAIKESFKADKKLEETLHRAVLVENKKLTRDFFVEGGYGHLMPRQVCFRRSYRDHLAADIIAGLGLHSTEGGCVLKLCNRARGAGCIPILAADLDLALERLLILPDNVEAWLDGQDREFPVECKWGCFQEQIRHWWSNECPVFVAEELCKSAPVQQEGKAFDGTMRVGFSLHRVEEPAESEAEEEEELTFHNAPDPEPAVEFPGEALPGSLSIEWLGGYWKLPAEDTTSSDLTAKVISKARQGTAPVDVKQLQEVYAALGDSVQQVFTNASLSPQTLLRRYPDISELGAFVASRLACSMRMRDPTKSQMVLGLAQTSLSKCKEPGSVTCKPFVESYIHRNFGVLEALMGRWNKTADHFQRAISVMPTNATARYLLGMQCLETELWKKAIAQFEAALQLDPDFKAPWINMAVANLRLGRWHEVIRACDAGLYRHPNTAHCFYNKGLAYFFLAVEEEAGVWQKWPGLPRQLRAAAIQAFEDARASLERPGFAFFAFVAASLVSFRSSLRNKLHAPPVFASVILKTCPWLRTTAKSSLQLY